MTAGVVVVVAVLAVALIGGGLWRRANGRMRSTIPASRRTVTPDAPARTSVVSGVSVSGVPVSGAGLSDAAAATAAGAGTATAAGAGTATAAGAGTATAAGAGLMLTGQELGHALGDRATLLQFSSAFCAPCRATRRVLADVAGMTPGVAHIEIDAESRLDLVRRLNVLRTPTVLVLAGDGTVVRRASGQPRKPDVIAALGAAVDYNS